MHSKVIVSTLVVTSLLGAPVVAFAQNEPAQPNTTTSTEGHMGATVPHHKMKSGHRRTGTTVGMSHSTGKARPGGQSVAHKPPAS